MVLGAAGGEGGTECHDVLTTRVKSMLVITYIRYRAEELCWNRSTEAHINWLSNSLSHFLSLFV